MGELVSYAIPNLVQGISQQPDAQRDPSQGEIQINGVSSAADGLRKREGTRCVAKVSTSLFGDVAFHQIQRDTDEQYLVVISKTAIRVFDLAGVEKAVTAASGAYNYLSSVVSAQADIRAATIADYTFISNTKAVPAMSASLAPATARPATNEALVWVKAANYGQTYKVNVNGTTATVTTAVAPVITSGTTVTENRISAADIAESIKTALAGVTGVTIVRSGSVLHLTSSSTITIAATDARSNADITAITNKVQSFTDLPTIAPTGYQVEITGDPGNQFDGYYVQFVPRSGTFGEGAWEETVGAGVKYQLDQATMPHLLVRLSNGTFWFGPANGSTQSGTTIPSWGKRSAGDEDTAPDPSFIGNPIQDVFVFRNRLGFLADENIILSRARDFFEFFPETVTTVLDSDPIDLAASNSRVSVLRYAVPYQDELIVFSDQIQFRFSAADAVLTPSSAQITVLTQYEMDPGCRPIPVQGTIVFAQANGQWTRFREFSVRGAGTALVADAEDLSGHASGYVPNQVTRLAQNDTGNVWFALSIKTGYTKRLYAYKYFVRSTGAGAERAQASWSFWELNGADRILSILCVKETLYLLAEYGTEVWLEKVAVADRISNVSPAPYPLLLDRAVSTTTDTPSAIRVATGSYNATADTTTWTLPYTVRATTQAWSGYGPSSNGGVLLGQVTSGDTITARGNWATGAPPIWFGEQFNFRFRFSRFKLYRDIGQGKVAANVMRTQVRHAKLRYHDTRFFRVLVQAEGRDTATYTFDGWQLGVRNSQLGSAIGQSAGSSIEPLFDLASTGLGFASIPGGYYVLGYGFYLGTEQKVGGVGVYAGSTKEHKVGIWHVVTPNPYSGLDSAVLVWQGLVPASSGITSGNFRWIDVDGPLMQPGIYLVGATWDDESVPASLVPGQVNLLVNAIMGTVETYGAVNTEPDVIPQLNVDLSDTAYRPISQSPTYTLGFFTANLSFGASSSANVDVEDKQYFDGVFRIPIASRGENAIIELQNDTPHPCQFSTCEWVGLITGQARSLQ